MVEHPEWLNRANNKNKYNPQEPIFSIKSCQERANNKNKYNPQEQDLNTITYT